MKFLGGVKWYCGRQGSSYEGSCAAERAPSVAAITQSDNSGFFIFFRNFAYWIYDLTNRPLRFQNRIAVIHGGLSIPSSELQRGGARGLRRSTTKPWPRCASRNSCPAPQPGIRGFRTPEYRISDSGAGEKRTSLFLHWSRSPAFHRGERDRSATNLRRRYRHRGSRAPWNGRARGGDLYSPDWGTTRPVRPVLRAPECSLDWRADLPGHHAFRPWPAERELGLTSACVQLRAWRHFPLRTIPSALPGAREIAYVHARSGRA